MFIHLGIKCCTHYQCRWKDFLKSFASFYRSHFFFCSRLASVLTQDFVSSLCHVSTLWMFVPQFYLNCCHI